MPCAGIPGSPRISPDQAGKAGAIKTGINDLNKNILLIKKHELTN
jgi:hypothetical protein